MIRQESVFHPKNKKFVKLPFFTNCFFPKYDIVKISSTDDICLSLCLELNELGLTMNKKLWGYTLKLKITKIFFMKQYFFLNSNHDHPPQSAVNFIIYQNCSQKDIKLLSRKDVIALFTFNLCFIRISSVVYPQSYC